MTSGVKKKCELVIDAADGKDEEMAEGAAYILAETDPNRNVMKKFLDQLEVFSETVYIELLSHCAARQEKLDEGEEEEDGPDDTDKHGY